MLSISKVSELMTECPFTLSPKSDVVSALKLMRNHKIRHLPVVDEAGGLLGIVSERDIVLAPEYSEQQPDVYERDDEYAVLQDTKINEIYTRSPTTIDEDASLGDAARIIFENKIGCLPVTRSSELVGIVTESDFVKLVMREAEGATV